MASAAESERRAAAGERRWFRDLEQGTGDAASLDEEVRQVIRLATVDIAADLAAADRSAREQAERQRVAALRENDRLLKEQRNRQAQADRAQWLERANDFDVVVIVSWFWVSVTIIGPWLVGFFVLKDGPLLSREAGVFDTEARDYFDYFWALYFAGLAVVSLVVAAVLLLRPWRGRWLWGVTVGLILAVGSTAVVLPHAQGLWRDSEAETLQLLETGYYPFGESFFTCGAESAMVTDSSGELAQWQVHTARRANSDTTSCNRLVVYRGWERVDQVDAEDGREFDSRPQVNEGTTTADTVFSIEAADGSQITISLVDYDSGWGP